jgi:hypothetical protein
VWGQGSRPRVAPLGRRHEGDARVVRGLHFVLEI